jgi:hypothetical protein
MALSDMQRGTLKELGIEITETVVQPILGIAAPLSRNHKASRDDTVFVVLFNRSMTLVFHGVAQNVASSLNHIALPRSALVDPLDVTCLTVSDRVVSAL